MPVQDRERHKARVLVHVDGADEAVVKKRRGCLDAVSWQGLQRTSQSRSKAEAVGTRRPCVTESATKHRELV